MKILEIGVHYGLDKNFNFVADKGLDTEMERALNPEGLHDSRFDRIMQPYMGSARTNRPYTI